MKNPAGRNIEALLAVSRSVRPYACREAADARRIGRLIYGDAVSLPIPNFFVSGHELAPKCVQPAFDFRQSQPLRCDESYIVTLWPRLSPMPISLANYSCRVFLQGVSACAVLGSGAFHLACCLLIKVGRCRRCRGCRLRYWRRRRRVLRSLLNRGRWDSGWSHPQTETRIRVRWFRQRVSLSLER